MKEPQMLEALKRADPAAREELYRQNSQRLYATACYFLGAGDSEAEDMVHETFAAAFKSIEGFEGRSSLYTWLNHICVNLCFSRIRERKRLCAAEAFELERLARPGAMTAAAAADEQALKKEMSGKIAAWMSRLKQACREVLHLRYQEGLSLNEIRERLKQPLGTVAARLARCIESLKKFAEKDAR